jgi:hypothetical protein
MSIVVGEQSNGLPGSTVSTCRSNGVRSLEQPRQLGSRHDCPRAGFVNEPGQLRQGQTRVQRHDGGADLQDAEQVCEEGRNIRQGKRHRVAGVKREQMQLPRCACTSGFQLGVGVDLVRKVQRRRLRNVRASCMHRQNLAELHSTCQVHRRLHGW